jgi:RNA polymerase sigma-70 factor (ECF subfamily)
MGSSGREGSETVGGGAAATAAAAAGMATTVEDRARELDAQLVRRARAGDPSAWPVLVERFSGYVHAIAIGFGLAGDRAEDVFQEVFTRAFTHLDTLRDEGALRPWIAQMTRRAAIDRLRADTRESPSLIDAEVPQDDARLERIETALAVRRALEELPDPFAEVLRRFFLEDQSYRAIGEALGMPAGTIASRISRGLTMLRELLEEDAAAA